ncbi:1-acyl-sn-glycerol-3-phosphate acyltransferase alpha isoform X1 [Nasonia vitripennis]|uniref:1-acyl-sn-glycerol-3-phosphate acyltransferase n=1 Tax=Nasonia vitripennis TaxID=7425 RepID=A0A7M7HDD8_NASVI|nr:1-acyl-sn-glycerol-3-phosphate acyltransferase alpha isoform X1 [Nasonia vitripennis]
MSLGKLFSHVKFYFKYALYYSYCGIVASILLPYVLLHPMDVLNQLPFAKLSMPLIPVLGLSYEIRGREQLALDRACIIVANHQSAFDFMGMIRVWPIMRKCALVAKKLLFYGWPTGLSAWLSGTIFIDKKNWQKYGRILEDAIRAYKEQKVKVWIFPEGTRYHEGGIHEFKRGAFYMAIKLQLPILPVVYSEYYFLSIKEKRFDSGMRATSNPNLLKQPLNRVDPFEGKIIMKALPAIPTEGLELEDVPELMAKTRSLMTETYDSLNEELRASLSQEESHRRGS